MRRRRAAGLNTEREHGRVLAIDGNETLYTVFVRPFVRQVSTMAEAHSRGLATGAAWVATLAVGCAQYGYATFAVRAGTPAHAGAAAVGAGGVWGSGTLPSHAVAWGLAAWVACGAAGSIAFPRLRRRFGLTPQGATTAGAAACAGGLLMLDWAGNPPFALAAYVLTAGLGAGLACRACADVAVAWHPGRSRAVTLVSGALGYAAIPVFMLVAGAQDRTSASGALAWAILLAVAACAPLLSEPSSRLRRGETPRSV